MQAVKNGTFQFKNIALTTKETFNWPSCVVGEPFARWTNTCKLSFTVKKNVSALQDSCHYIMEGVDTLRETPLPAVRLPFQVFVAKYNYDPVQYSPNDNPEAELTLTEGDYLFIYGEIDEVRKLFNVSW